MNAGVIACDGIKLQKTVARPSRSMVAGRAILEIPLFLLSCLNLAGPLVSEGGQFSHAPGLLSSALKFSLKESFPVTWEDMLRARVGSSDRDLPKFERFSLPVLRLRGCGSGQAGVLTKHRSLNRPGGALVGKDGWGGGKILKRNAVMELVKKKREKSKRKRERQTREAILEMKREQKQYTIVSAIIMSACLMDDDTKRDIQRVGKAIDKFERDSQKNEAKALAELERELWIPPRVRDTSGISESFASLPWDFEDTPQVRAERARYREENTITNGRHLFIEDDPQRRRMKQMLGEDSSEEVSAPDYDFFTHIDPSIYKCPEGDKENPHRLPGIGKEVVLDAGCNVECQTNFDMEKPLTIDPLKEGCTEVRESLEETLYQFRKKMTYRWAQKYPRYRACLEREIERLEILIPHSRPQEIPVEEWVPPMEIWKLMEEGPEPFELPDDVLPEDYEQFELVRAELERLQREQETKGLLHYHRLLKEGRVPPPPEQKDKLTEDEQMELEREETERNLKAEYAQSDVLHDAVEGGVSFQEIEELQGMGYNATEALEVLNWQQKAQNCRVDWGALQIPMKHWNKWEEVQMTLLPDGESHLERIMLSDSKYNSERVIEAKVYHCSPDWFPPKSQEEELQRIEEGELDLLHPSLCDPERLHDILQTFAQMDPRNCTTSEEKFEYDKIHARVRRLRRQMAGDAVGSGRVIFGADGEVVRRQTDEKTPAKGEETEESNHQDANAGEDGEMKEGGEEKDGEESESETPEEVKERVRCLARGFLLLKKGEQLQEQLQGEVDAGAEPSTCNAEAESRVGFGSARIRSSVGDIFDAELPSTPSKFGPSGSSDITKVLQTGGEAVLDVMFDDGVMMVIEAALKDRLTYENHLRWLTGDPAFDTDTQAKTRLLISTMVEAGVAPEGLKELLQPEAEREEESKALVSPAIGDSQRALSQENANGKVRVRDGDGAGLANRGGSAIDGVSKAVKGGSVSMNGGNPAIDARRERLREVKALIKKLSTVKATGGGLESTLVSLRLTRLREEAATLMGELAQVHSENQLPEGLPLHQNKNIQAVHSEHGGEKKSKKKSGDVHASGKLLSESAGGKESQGVGKGFRGDASASNPAQGPGGFFSRGFRAMHREKGFRKRQGLREPFVMPGDDLAWRVIPENPTEMYADNGVSDPSKHAASVWVPEALLASILGKGIVEDGSSDSDEDSDDALGCEDRDKPSSESYARNIGPANVSSLEDVQRHTGCNITISPEPVVGRLITGKGLSSIEIFDNVSVSAEAPDWPANSSLKGKKVPPQYAHLADRVEDLDSTFFLPEPLHVFYHFELKGKPASRRAAQSAILDLAMQCQRPPWITEEHFQKVMKWREWYFGHRKVVQWDERHNTPQDFVQSLPEEAHAELGLEDHTPETPVESRELVGLLTELHVSMKERGQLADFEEIERCHANAEAAVFEEPPTMHKDDFASYLREMVAVYLPSRTAALRVFLEGEYEEYHWYREEPQGVYLDRPVKPWREPVAQWMKHHQVR